MPNDSIDIWSIELDVSAAVLDEHRRLLAPDERERAGRFVRDIDRRRWTMARGALRVVLGRRLGVPPERVRFSYGERGKPALAPEHAPAVCHFNLAHSAGVALVALGRGGPLGVDVEQVREIQERWRIVERFFSPAEVAAFRDLPEHQHTRAFFNCWTRKESVMKALGMGFALPLDAFDVTLKPDAPAALTAMRGTVAEAAGWSLCHLAPRADYIGAVATRADGPWRVIEHRY